MKIFKVFVISAIFFFFLLTFYYIHIKFFKIDVIFYSAISDGILAAFSTGIIVLSHRYFSVFSIFERSQMIVIWLLLGYVFAISIPTVIDRSLSFYILEKLHQRGGSIALSSFDNIIKNEYMEEHRLVNVRMTEQKKSGTITIRDNCVKLTERGKKIVKFSLFFRKNLLPKDRLIMGEYTDDLINPFRNGLTKENYNCD
jgi:hypothetical protein